MSVMRRVVKLLGSLTFKMLVLAVMGLVNFTQCSRLGRENNMVSAEDLKNNIQKQVSSLDDVYALFPKTVNEVHHFSLVSQKHAKKAFLAIISRKASERSFANTAGALDTIMRDVGVASGIFSVLEMVHPDKAMRDVSHEAALAQQQFLVDALYDKALYGAFKEYVEGNARHEQLDAQEQYFLDETMRYFEHGGLNLPQSELDKVKQVEKDLAELEMNFAKNIAEDTSFIAVPENELAGVDANFVQSLQKDSEGRYILRCDYPTNSEVMEYCSCESTRKNFFFAFNNRAYPKNIQILSELVTKRQQLARLLGYESFSAWDITLGMAKNPERVERFLLDLINKSTPKAQQEVAILADNLPEGVTLDPQGNFDGWSFPYVKMLYKKQHLAIDDHEIAEYFPVEKTLEGVFSVYQKFLGLTFTFSKPAWAWHDDVRLIQINDKASGVLRGYLFIDLYPRDNKYTHACQAGIVPAQKMLSGKIEPAVAVIIANFPRSTQERPALLKFSDVETFFHEFGHAMHTVLGATLLASQSGTSVKTDFVEMPSQMFEEWIYDKQVLQILSSHYETGKPLPDELIERMVNLKQFDSGMFVLRQSFFSLYSLQLFSQADADASSLWQTLSTTYVPYVRFEPDTHFYTSFGHLAMSSYAAKYYSYLWAKVFAVDVFYKIKAEGLLDERVGRVFVDKILSKGGSADPDSLLQDYLGREPQIDAFLKDLGIS